MKKQTIALVLLSVFFAIPVFSQNKVEDLTSRYVVIDNFDSFFNVKDDCVESQVFYVKNFDEELSSKPYHVTINEFDNVIKFSIASSSEQFHRQRRCFLRLEKEEYIKIFYKVLKAMEVTHVVVGEELMSLDVFYQSIKQ